MSRIESKTFSVTGVGSTPAVDILNSNQIAVAYQINVTGSVVYSVEHTLDGINWIENTDNRDNSVNSDGNYVLPVKQCRATIKSGDGSITFIVRQHIR